MHTLCIIDMQDYFEATAWALEGVLEEIKLAKEREDFIIVVEYQGCGATNANILKALRGYHKVHYCNKNQNDGASEIVTLAHRYRIPLKKVRVVGVNLSFCVHDTVRGFAKNFSTMVHKIFVPVYATSCTDRMDHATGYVKKLAEDHNQIMVIG